MSKTFNEKVISLDTRLRELRKELEDDLRRYPGRWSENSISNFLEQLDNKDYDYWQDPEREEE